MRERDDPQSDQRPTQYDLAIIQCNPANQPLQVMRRSLALAFALTLSLAPAPMQRHGASTHLDRMLPSDSLAGELMLAAEPVPQVLKLTSIPETVAAAGAASAPSDPAAQHRRLASHHHPAKRKREADDDQRPDIAPASIADSAAAATAVPTASAPYSGVDTAELAAVVPWARRRFVWEALQLQLQVCRASVSPNIVHVLPGHTCNCWPLHRSIALVQTCPATYSASKARN